ncbi:MAG: formylmethanofuran dehydrogenase subunit C [archaeon]|nr:formylmethanofuran dehydrogenase subunit C [archaeon]MCP8316821.1 formylmethanofuran dehydrogenase subunit C [archaeon]
MVSISLKLKTKVERPLDASVISPDVFAGKSLKDIESLEMWRGNKKINLGEIFDVSGESGQKPEEISIIIDGDLSKARRIGKQMTSGKIIVNGNSGFYIGDGMKGGEIHVHGNADSWLGVEMKGGIIEVESDAGDFVGSSYRGSRNGMSGGTITIKGNAGSEVGCWMKDGLIRIGGDVGLYAGIHMQGGTIFISGSSSGRLGAEMVGGKVILMGKVPDILPSFIIDEIRPNIKVGADKIAGPFYSFTGDVTEGGNGKLFISVPNNEHLKKKEAYIL